MRMAYALVINNPFKVVIEGATREHLLWLHAERPNAVFNYGVLEHRDDNTIVAEFHFEDETEAALFRTFHG